jgi:hypothetical protein
VCRVAPFLFLQCSSSKHLEYSRTVFGERLVLSIRVVCSAAMARVCPFLEVRLGFHHRLSPPLASSPLIRNPNRKNPSSYRKESLTKGFRIHRNLGLTHADS